jgi:hypothetical protein
LFGDFVVAGRFNVQTSLVVYFMASNTIRPVFVLSGIPYDWSGAVSVTDDHMPNSVVMPAPSS